MSTKPSKEVVRAAQRAADSEFFLARVLRQYQQAHNLDDEAFARLLRCQPGDLPRLALCRRPSIDQERFSHEVGHLAERFQLNADQLASIIRQVDAVNALRLHMTGSQQMQGLLMAARDREENTEDTGESSER